MKRRADRPKKRVFQGNKQVTASKQPRLDVSITCSKPDSIESTEKSSVQHVDNNTPRARKSKTKPTSGPSFIENSASFTKIKQEDVDFDIDNELTGFRFVDIQRLITFVQSLLCPHCKKELGANKRLSHVKEEKITQASTLTFTCQCQQTVEFCSSGKVGKVYEVNRRFPLAILAIGKNKKGAQRFLGNMNMPPPPAPKSWQNHKRQILKQTRCVADNSIRKAAQELRGEVTDEENDKLTDVTVSVDGTWHRRGFSSKHGIVTTLSVNGKNGKVIDTETLSNYCDSCAKHKNKLGVDEFELWKAAHVRKGLCNKNHTGSAGSMEPVGAETTFRRPSELHKLRYVRYLGDGDSKSYARVRDAGIYEGVDIEKLECCGHVQKRMMRQLTNKVTDLKNTKFQHNGKIVKGIGGGSGLKKAGILKIQGHYGAAMRQNVGNLQAMRNAIGAIFEHRNKEHRNCGTWCLDKKQNGQDPDQNSLPPYVMDSIRPVFETLSDDSLLEKCVHGGTQNTNESSGIVVQKQTSVAVPA
ncbi:uncharacterized protein [Littorina saxatilis]|uniref:uncharacterized protein n=1 Tax=Littorina saxatilis TaxID=31220 RepID=UPI0038B6AC89